MQCTLFHSFQFHFLFFRKMLIQPTKLIFWPVDPKLQFENLSPRWFWCRWSMDLTLRNSALLARFSFSGMAFKALHNLILVFCSTFTSGFHPLPQLPVLLPLTLSTHMHTLFLPSELFPFWTMCHVRRAMFFSLLHLYICSWMECPNLLGEFLLLGLQV